VPAPFIEYRGTFEFAIPPESVWDAIEHSERFEGWWWWLGEFRLEGGGLVPGAVLHGLVSPPVPYRMQVRVHLDECEAPKRIAATVAGDLVGRAHLRLEPDGGGTHVEVGWSLEMMQRPMRLAARVAYPLLRWGHDRVVDATVSGFRRHVEEAGGAT
jgi:uncharacterized protein YndB with AHSA1/START domain